MIEIDYVGPRRGAFALMDELGQEGLEATAQDLSDTIEYRDHRVQESLVHVALFVADPAIKGAISVGAGMVVKRVVRRFQQRHPGGAEIRVREKSDPPED